MRRRPPVLADLDGVPSELLRCEVEHWASPQPEPTNRAVTAFLRWLSAGYGWVDATGYPREEFRAAREVAPVAAGLEPDEPAGERWRDYWFDRPGEQGVS